MSRRQLAAGWLLPAVLALLLVLGLNGVGIAYRPEDPSLQQQLQRLKEIHDLVESSYVDEVDSRHLFEGAYNGMLQSLDPHSVYFNEDDLAEFNSDTDGEFGGLGIQVNMDDGWLTVITPMEGTPAFRAGIQPGDRLVEIEGRSTEGVTTSEAVKLLRGKPGTPVNIAVLHRAGGDTEKMTIVREIIQVKSIRGKKLVDAKSGVGYVRISAFQERTADDLRAAILDLQSQGMKALIVDLRFNGGGLLEEAVGCANLFVRKGVIVTTRGRTDEDNRTEIAVPENALPEFPVAVLVNDSSASASEILAGALQDHHRGLVVGMRTYGKGSVQTLVPMRDKRGAVKLTTARYFTPSGRCIDKRFLRSQAELESVPPEKRQALREQLAEYGIAPDIEVDLPAGEIDQLMRSFDPEILHPPTKHGNGAAPTAETEPKPAGTGAEAGSRPWVDPQILRASDVLKALIAIHK